MAHKNFSQLLYLLKMLDYKDNDIYIHVDARANFDTTPLYSVCKNSNIYFINRLKVNWGTYNMIQVEINLLKAAISKYKYSYYHLLTGQDLPIKSHDYINNFFEKKQGLEFISFDKYINQEDIDRIELFHPIVGRHGKDKTFLENSKYICDKLFCKFQKTFKLYRDLQFLEIKKGPVYFSITDKLAKQIVQNEKHFQSIYKYTFCADEIFLQTYVYNSCWKEHLYKASNDFNASNMRLIDWDRGTPYTWTIGDTKTLDESNMLFARKFDINVDKAIIEYVYERYSK